MLIWRKEELKSECLGGKLPEELIDMKEFKGYYVAKISKTFYKNGYSAWDGRVERIIWKVRKIDTDIVIWFTGYTRKEAIGNLERNIKNFGYCNKHDSTYPKGFANEECPLCRRDKRIQNT